MLEFLSDVWVWIPIGITVASLFLVLLDFIFKRFSKPPLGNERQFVVKYSKKMVVFMWIPLALCIVTVFGFAIAIFEEVYISEIMTLEEALFYDAIVIILPVVTILLGFWTLHIQKLRIYVSEEGVHIVRFFRADKYYSFDQITNARLVGTGFRRSSILNLFPGLLSVLSIFLARYRHLDIYIGSKQIIGIRDTQHDNFDLLTDHLKSKGVCLEGWMEWAKRVNDKTK